MTLHDPLIPEKETALHAHDLLDSLAGIAPDSELAAARQTREAATRAQVVGPRTLKATSQILEVSSVCDPCVGRRCSYRPVKCLQAFQVNDVVSAFAQIIEPGLFRK